MAIAVGTQLGSHEITALLGKGGMGEVYRARDSKLKREVAIKILSAEFSRDPERVARFQREAEVLASLNHPNIAAIHDLQQYSGGRFLVLEFVDGETLAERIARGPMPLDEALNIAKQICDALEAAHEKGVVHRDLKPANIKITPDGNVKVLDFGLAKAFQEQSQADLSNSPTLMSAASVPGVILGTAAYMSPEQARGRKVDKRTDIFALGCVLCEMLTGKRAFDGEDVTEILGAVVRLEPDWTRLPADVPPEVQRLLRQCLIKNAANRRQSAGDIRIDLDQVMAAPAVGAVYDRPRSWRERIGWIVATAVCFIGLIAVLFLWAPWRATSPADPLRLSAELGADVSLAINVTGNSAVALSPDGKTLAFVGAKNGATQIYVRRLGQLQAAPLSGTSGARSPFFSPDGQWLAFFVDGKLRKISVTGGAAVTLADAPTSVGGGSWGENGNIVFTPTIGGGLHPVSSEGGKVEPLTKLADGEVTHRWPQVLPGGKAVIYISHTAIGGYDDATIMIQPLPSGKPKVLIRGGYCPQYVSSGHLVYMQDGTLFAAPFDLARQELTGPSVPAVEGVSGQPDGGGNAQFAVSQTGALVYLPNESTGAVNSVVWMGQDGKTSPLRATPSDWGDPQFSPDGRRLALDILEGNNNDVWVYEWARDTLTRLTFDPASDLKPVWTSDGKRIVFQSKRAKGQYNLYWQPADGTGEVQRLTESSNWQSPASFHPGGKYLAFSELTPQNGWDLVILPIEGDEKSGWKPGKPTVFLSTPANEQEPMFSPDGRWIAYDSNESGRNEVFVRPFPGPGGKWQISTGGGVQPVWSRTRHEIMTAAYAVEGDSFKAAKPRVWSEQPIQPLRPQRFFDLHPDGQRIAAAVPSGQAEEKLDKVTFIFNFADELRRLAPPAKK